MRRKSDETESLAHCHRRTPFLDPGGPFNCHFGDPGVEGLDVSGILFSLFIAYFFRNPKRETPDLQNIVLSPADGRSFMSGNARKIVF